MDALSRERYPFDLPEWETRRRPRSRLEPISYEQALVNRYILCGTTDLSVPSRGVHSGAKAARLIHAIRSAGRIRTGGDVVTPPDYR